MKTKLVLIGMFAFLSAGGYIFAGVVNNTVPTVVSGNVAYGSLVAARNSADANERIGCIVSSDNTATCNATNAAGVSLSGSTGNADIVNVVRSVTGDSMVIFNVDSSGELAAVSVYHSSMYLK